MMPAAATPRRRTKAPSKAATLVAVTGMSPAVVTETVWALAQEKPRILPERVVFVTTSVGAEVIRRQLFQPSSDLGGMTAWQALRTALGATDDQLIAEEPRVICRVNPRTGAVEALDDIQTPEENNLAAHCILEEVRRVAMNPDTRLIASIAGGRKTLGALLHAAVSLLGREGDRLTHVLVRPPFDGLPGFYFPSQPGGPLRDREGKGHAPKQAQVVLADVPFVPLRNRFEDLRETPGSFSGLVRKFSRGLKEDAARPRLLEIHYRQKTLWLDDKPVKIRIRALALLHFLAEAQAAGKTPVDQPAASKAIEFWLCSATFIPAGVKPSKMDADAIRHELNYLRTELRKHGFEIARRALHLPPHTLRLRG